MNKGRNRARAIAELKAEGRESPRTLKKLAEVLGVSTRDLVSENGTGSSQT